MGSQHRLSEPPAPATSTAPQSSPGSAAQAGAAPQKYTGDPISVNLKDVDLRDFFRLIHEISGLNVVLDPAVRGTVTLVLDEVPWDQALDIVLRNNGLTKEIDGNVLRIATQDTLKHEADQRRELLKAQSDAIEPVTVTRVLSYAKAATMVVTLKKVPDPARRSIRGHSLEHSRHSGHSFHDSEDRRFDPPAGSKIAAG